MPEENKEEFKKNASKYLDFLLKVLIENKASDLYLTYDEHPAVRIDDSVIKLDKLEKLDEETLVNIAYWMMTDVQWEIFRKKMNMDLWWSFEWRRFRINISYQRGRVMIVFRLLQWEIPTIDAMKLPNVFKDIIARKSGIIFVTWPTWSWKSTSIAAMIEEINIQQKKHIITIEDPIEYEFKPKNCVIDQKELEKDVPDFVTALKWAMRQRPDVLFVWEVRDPKSISAVITLAETWHLVFTTIHTKSAPQTISRILDSFPANQQMQVRVQLSETLLAVISQRLIKKQDDKWSIAAFEILLTNPAIANLIRENQIVNMYNVIHTSKSKWMISLEDYMLWLVKNGDISYEDALYFANRQDYVRNEIGH